MSIRNSIDKLKREISYKKLIVLDGNVLDLYFDDGKFVNLNKLLVKNLKETKLFDDVYVWDRIEGLLEGDPSKLSNSCSAPKGEAIEGIDDDLFDDDNQMGMYKNPTDFYGIVYQNLMKSQQKACFIINYSNYLFPQEQALSEQDRDNLTRIVRGIREETSKMSENGSCVIFVASNIAMVPVSTYQNNPDAHTITLSNPDREERKDIIKSLTSYFKLKTDLESDEASQIDLIDGLDNFTTKEIIQVAKLSKNVPDYLNVSKLLALYKYGKKESPWEVLESKKIKNIEEILSKRVKGQDDAIRKVKDVVIRAKTGLSGLQHSKSKSKPKGVLFFAGPTGVGKTELAKSLAEFLFGDEAACVRFDMSEYNHEHSDQKLIGAPPGYVGYEAGGQLTNLIKERPFCVLLFDEIEKAHPKILDKFLQILEDGRLTDNKGETVYFSECIIIFTSNIGAAKVSPSMDYNEIKSTILAEIKNKFENEINRPELLGRIGYSNIVTFNFIKDKNVSKAIASSKINPIIEYLKESKKLNLVFENKDEFLDYVISKADPSKGGRDILNKLEDILVTELSYFLFENEGYYYPDSTAKVIFEKESGKVKIVL